MLQYNEVNFINYSIKLYKLTLKFINSLNNYSIVKMANLKQLAFQALIVYSFFMCLLLNTFGIVLSYQQQFYEWNIINLKDARYSLFTTAFQHLIIFVFCVVYQFWKEYKCCVPNKDFSPLKQFDQQNKFHSDYSV